jgi:hypothetical protein
VSSRSLGALASVVERATMFEGMMQEEGGSDPSVGIGQGREQVATLGWAAGKGGRGGGLEEGATTQDGWWPWGCSNP